MGSGYAVTTAHALDEIARHNHHTVLLRANGVNGHLVTVEIPIKDWVRHSDSSVDLAVYRISLKESGIDGGCFFVKPDTIAIPGATTFNGVSLGDDLFFPGLFWPHKGEEKNTPIIRAGMLSAMPEEKVQAELGPGNQKLIDAYLVETRSIGGLSGSPVFFYFDGGLTRYGKVVSPKAHFFLLGVVQGHYDAQVSLDDSVFDDRKEKVNMGVGIVIPATKLLEMLESDEVQRARDVEEEEDRKNTGFAPSQ